MWRVPCEDANSKLVEFVTAADVDDEKRFDDSFMQFWKLKFGHKAKFCSDFEHKVWPRVWSWSSSETFETEVWSVFCCWGLVRLWSGCLVKILKLKFGRNAIVRLRSWILEFDQDLCNNLLLWLAELNPRVRCAFGNVFILQCPWYPATTRTVLVHAKHYKTVVGSGTGVVVVVVRLNKESVNRLS